MKFTLPRPRFHKPSQAKLTKILTLTAAAVFLLSGLLWTYMRATDPERVFWGAIENSLKTNGISAQFTTDNGQKSESFSAITYGPVPTVEVLNKSYESGDQAEPVSVSHNIGTKEADYLRFIKYQPETGTLAADKAKEIEGVWASKAVFGEEADNLLYNQYIYTFTTSFPVIFANLDAQDRKAVTELLRKAITINSADAKSVEITNGRKTYGYVVSIDIAAYIDVLKAYGDKTKYAQFDRLDSEQFKDAPPINLELAIDVLSQQIIGVMNNGIAVKYDSHGLISPVNLIPRDTITIEEFQKKQEDLQQ